MGVVMMRVTMAVMVVVRGMSVRHADLVHGGCTRSVSQNRRHGNVRLAAAETSRSGGISGVRGDAGGVL